MTDCAKDKGEIINIPLTKWRDHIKVGYLFMIGGLLPFYHRNGFVMIGDRKYRLFFVVSVIVIPSILILNLILCFCKEKSDTGGNREVDRKLDSTDIFVLLFAFFTLVSWLLSAYSETALWGYEDWHMGALSQFLFVGIYFCMRIGSNGRTTKNTVRASQLLLIISGVIFTLGIVNRFGIDPLHMYDGLAYWNKTHLLATIGNINWYSGYVCTIFPLGVWYYITQAEHGVSTGYGKRILFAGYSMISFGTIVTQGSMSGMLAFGIVMLILFGLCMGDFNRWKQFLKLNLLFTITAGMLLLWYRLSDKEQIYFAADLTIEKYLMLSFATYLIVIIFLIMSTSVWHIRKQNDRTENEKSGKTGKNFRGIYFTLLIAGGIITFVLLLIHMRPEWGSGRGLLWSVTFQAYQKMPLKEKLFGVGADCFAPYMGEHHASELSGFLAEWWGDAVVACAHNEWLNMLINMGLFGAVIYGGIFLSVIWHFYQRVDSQNPFITGVLLCVIAYVVNATVSFQQVMSTPMIFMLIGLAQNLRKSVMSGEKN